MTQGTVSADKNELLFSEFGVNYNDLPEIYRKGTVLVWSSSEKADTQKDHSDKRTQSSGKTRDLSQHTFQEEVNDVSKSHDPHSTSHDSNSQSHDSTAAAAAIEELSLVAVDDRSSRRSKSKVKRIVEVLHIDIIGSKFWIEHADILHGE